VTAGAASRTGAKSPQPNWTLAACILVSSLSFVEGSVLIVTLPAIRASFGAVASEVQWVVDAYLLPLSALLLMALGGRHHMADGELVGRVKKKGRRSLSSSGLSIVLLGEPSR
jgi:MFS family permease